MSRRDKLDWARWQAVSGVAIPRSRDDDSSVWASGFSMSCFGVRIGVRSNRPLALRSFEEHLPPLTRPTAGSRVDRVFSFRLGREEHVLFDDLQEPTRAVRFESLLQAFERRVKLFVAETAPERVFVHAGAVGWQGEAILVPGRSFTGKTTLVRELLRGGAAYYSDEFAVLDLQGRLHPYPQPLGIREERSRAQERRRVEELGGVVGTEPLTVGRVLLAPYEAGAQWRPVRVPTTEGVQALLDNTAPTRNRAATVHTALRRALVGARVLRGPRGEAGETAQMILRGAAPRMAETTAV